MVKFIEQKVEWWLPGSGGGEGQLLNGQRVSVFQEEKNSGDYLHNISALIELYI